uniref:Uncharacterized protein n=1 Tax=Oryza rufipogon TaxID=4529 RepID=A0A0E0RHD6_ORYRU
MVAGIVVGGDASGSDSRHASACRAPARFHVSEYMRAWLQGSWRFTEGRLRFGDGWAVMATFEMLQQRQRTAGRQRRLLLAFGLSKGGRKRFKDHMRMLHVNCAKAHPGARNRRKEPAAGLEEERFDLLNGSASDRFLRQTSF